MSATVDGTEWKATPTVVAGTEYSAYFSFLGYNLNGNKINIVVKKSGDAVSTGTYNISLNPFGDDGNLNLPELTTYGTYMGNKDEQDDEAETNYYSTSGSVIISSVDGKKINGTFTFTARNKSLDEIEITNGKFSNVSIL